jgi:hypothetical protein
MQCPDCKNLRHDGPCNWPQDDESLSALEWLKLDAQQAVTRYFDARKKFNEEKTNGKS